MAGGMHWGGVHGRGVCVAEGHVWQGGMRAMHPPWQILRLRYMVNERAVRILLECILVADFLTLEKLKVTRNMKSLKYF